MYTGRSIKLRFVGTINWNPLLLSWIYHNRTRNTTDPFKLIIKLLLFSYRHFIDKVNRMTKISGIYAKYRFLYIMQYGKSRTNVLNYFHFLKSVTRPVNIGKPISLPNVTLIHCDMAGHYQKDYIFAWSSFVTLLQDSA